MDKKKIQLGIAPLGWSNDDLPELGGSNTFEQCVNEMAQAGFAGCEAGNKYPRDPLVLKEALEQRGLRLCSQWFSTYVLRDGLAAVEKSFRKQLVFLKALGASVVNPSEQTRSSQGQQREGVFAAQARYTPEEWKTFVHGMNHLGGIAREEGFRFCYHHHMGTAVQSPGEVERFLNDTQPEAVSLVYDSGHFAYAGADPGAELKKCLPRVGHVHLKDLRREPGERARKEDWPFLTAVKEGIFTVPGDGIIDFPSIFALLEEGDYQGWMVVEAEQDPARAHPLEYARKARSYIRRETGL